MEKEKSKSDWSDSDTIEANPEFQEMYEEHSIDFFKKNHPEFYELMKKAGLKEDADESAVKKD